MIGNERWKSWFDSASLKADFGFGETWLTTRTQVRHARHTEDVAGCSPGPCESIRRMESEEEKE